MPWPLPPPPPIALLPVDDNLTVPPPPPPPADSIVVLSLFLIIDDISPLEAFTDCDIDFKPPLPTLILYVPWLKVIEFPDLKETLSFV